MESNPPLSKMMAFFFTVELSVDRDFQDAKLKLNDLFNTATKMRKFLAFCKRYENCTGFIANELIDTEYLTGYV